jgi:F-type H+-transporting ATPase subunit delta
MAELSTIARPYAQAVFEVAQKTGLPKWSEWLAVWGEVAAHPDIKLLVNDPRLTSKNVVKIFLELVARAGTETTDACALNFISDVIENGRLELLPEIGRQFEQLKNAFEGQADAVIESAFPLAGDELSNLLVSLEAKFSVKLKPSITVNPDLIGGVRVVVGDQVLDGSVKGRLDAMKATLVA